MIGFSARLSVGFLALFLLVACAKHPRGYIRPRLDPVGGHFKHVMVGQRVLHTFILRGDIPGGKYTVETIVGGLEYSWGTVDTDITRLIRARISYTPSLYYLMRGRHWSPDSGYLSAEYATSRDNAWSGEVDVVVKIKEFNIEELSGRLDKRTGVVCQGRVRVRLANPRPDNGR